MHWSKCGSCLPSASCWASWTKVSVSSPFCQLFGFMDQSVGLISLLPVVQLHGPKCGSRLPSASCSASWTKVWVSSPICQLFGLHGPKCGSCLPSASCSASWTKVLVSSPFCQLFSFMNQSVGLVSLLPVVRLHGPKCGSHLPSASCLGFMDQSVGLISQFLGVGMSWPNMSTSSSICQWRCVTFFHLLLYEQQVPLLSRQVRIIPSILFTVTIYKKRRN